MTVSIEQDEKRRNGIKMGKKEKKVIRRFGNKTEEDEGEKKRNLSKVYERKKYGQIKSFSVKGRG